MDLEDITAAILAGGLGTRLAPLIPGQQKVVAKVKQRPFLEYILNQLNNTGFKNAVICTGYLGDQVEKAFGNSYKDISLVYSKEESPLGTAGAIALAIPYLKSENILITNGDSFIDCDLQSFYEFHLEKVANASIILREIDDTSRYGKVDINKNDEIVGFEEKNENGGSGLINGGLYFIKKSFLLEIPKGRPVSFEKELFPKWITKGLYGFKSKGRFIDIGTPQSYQEAQSFFSSI